MIVWGGYDGLPPNYVVNTGGRYDPVMNIWDMTSTAGAPSPRQSHTVVWTGSLMIVWGGQSARGDENTGGRYALGQAVDDDGDGFSDCQGDCNDANPAVHPGAAEICDGLDNDCNGVIDENDPLSGAFCDTGQLGVCEAGTLRCDNGSLACFRNFGPGPEICGNHLDDDCDGTVDDPRDSDADGVSDCADNCPEDRKSVV